jgi:large subunit ribosomal protein L24
MGVYRRGFQAMFERNKWKVLRGDKVMITAGKDRGQTGTVVKVVRDDKFPRVVVEGLNLVSARV